MHCEPLNLIQEISTAHLSGFSDATSQAFISHQESLVQKWAILWRSVILSSLDKTLFPYCRYLKTLDLYDLGQLFEADRFRGKIEKIFFEGDLSSFRVESDTPRKIGLGPRKGPMKQLNFAATINKIGDVITDRAPLLEALFGNRGPASSNILIKWIPKLTNLQELKLFDGQALADDVLPDLVNTSCPLFRKLGIYFWHTPDSDHQLATFLQGIRAPSLQSLELFSLTGIGAESFLALNRHGATLRLLRLCVKPESCPSLSLLKECTNIETLILEDSTGSSDLERTDYDKFLEIIEWLQSCKQLRTLEFDKFPPAAAMTMPLLKAGTLPLQTLQVEGYMMKNSLEFHKAIRDQKTLRTLVLRGDAEGSFGDDVDALCESIGEVASLRDLKLRGVSEYFTNNHIIYLAGNLLNLEHLYVEGYGITDGVWKALGGLRNLQFISFYGLTNFTKDGLLGFIETLSRPGNEGIVVMVDYADIEGRLSEEEQAEVREAIVEKVDGRFEYTLYRGRSATLKMLKQYVLTIALTDPDISEYEGESD
ncbi:MAG: hypothetical protein M1820_009538 [Bogoriella megaspora]|nr:MAG: hypothetical protein M1820_009538 [Bogoriella megaspora]